MEIRHARERSCRAPVWNCRLFTGTSRENVVVKRSVHERLWMFRGTFRRVEVRLCTELVARELSPNRDHLHVFSTTRSTPRGRLVVDESRERKGKRNASLAIYVLRHTSFRSLNAHHPRPATLPFLPTSNPHPHLSSCPSSVSPSVQPWSTNGATRPATPAFEEPTFSQHQLPIGLEDQFIVLFAVLKHVT